MAGRSHEPYYFSTGWNTSAPVEDVKLQKELDEILAIYAADNHSAWDMGSDGTYTRRQPAKGKAAKGAQQVFIDRASR